MIKALYVLLTNNNSKIHNPETTPQSQSMEKLSSTKLVPGAKKAEDLCPENLTGAGGSIFKKTHMVSFKRL